VKFYSALEGFLFIPLRDIGHGVSSDALGTQMTEQAFYSVCSSSAVLEASGNNAMTNSDIIQRVPLCSMPITRIPMRLPVNYRFCNINAGHSFITKPRGGSPMEDDQLKMEFWLTILPLVAFGLILLIGDFFQLGV